MIKTINIDNSKIPSLGRGAAGMCSGREGFSPLCIFAKPLPTSSQGRESHMAQLFEFLHLFFAIPFPLTTFCAILKSNQPAM